MKHKEKTSWLMGRPPTEQKAMARRIPAATFINDSLCSLFYNFRVMASPIFEGIVDWKEMEKWGTSDVDK